MITSNNRQVTVNKKELLATIIKNREAHRKAFEEALLSFNTAYKLELEDVLARMNEGAVLVHPEAFESKQPYSALSSYDEVIDMLNLSVEENIVLDAQSFRELVRDQWGWKHIMDSSILSNNMVMSKYRH